ncbi:hypothetical protein [Pseudomonas qingdaonensis]|uniref:hypothetical protein n=1 Tax=Pseudomonas qingdaonensis TaxID=2056231 RepID=UPI00333F1324
MIRVLLSLDLKKSEDQRDAFYVFLKEKGWKKTNDVDTVWTLEYEDANPANDDNYRRIRNNIKSTLIEASEEFKLHRIEYVAQLGNAEYIAKAIRKEDGVYQQFNRPLYAE